MAGEGPVTKPHPKIRVQVLVGNITQTIYGEREIWKRGRGVCGENEGFALSPNIAEELNSLSLR